MHVSRLEKAGVASRTRKARCLGLRSGLVTVCEGILHLGARANPGCTRHGCRAERPRVQHLGARGQDKAPLAAVPQTPPSFPDFLPGERDQLSNWKNKRARRPSPVTPPAPHPAFKSGHGVSSNLSPPRPRTPPPPPRPLRVTKGRARRVPPRGSTGEPGRRRDHLSGPTGDPREKGAADKDGSPGAGPWKEGSGKRAGGSPWEGPSGLGSAVAAGPGDWPARSASGLHAP